MTISTSTSPRRRRLAGIASMALVSVLALGGCATSTDSTAADSASSTSTSASASSGSVSPVSTASTTQDATTTADTISDTAAAAQAFLDTLSEEQQDAVLYAYDDETKTTSWSNFPVTFVQRAGLDLADLTDEQQAAALEVLESLLSDEAYETVTGIMNGDVYLHENSSSTEASLGQYYIAFFGDPSDTSAFEVQFGGHHLSHQRDPRRVRRRRHGRHHLRPHPPRRAACGLHRRGRRRGPALRRHLHDAFAFFDSLTDGSRPP